MAIFIMIDQVRGKTVISKEAMVVTIRDDNGENVSMTADELLKAAKNHIAGKGE